MMAPGLGLGQASRGEFGRTVRAVEMPAVFKDPIEDGLGEIRVVEEPPPGTPGFLVVKSIGRGVFGNRIIATGS